MTFCPKRQKETIRDGLSRRAGEQQEKETGGPCESFKKCTTSETQPQQIPTMPVADRIDKPKDQKENVSQTMVPEESYEDDNDDEGWTVATYHKGNTKNNIGQSASNESVIQEAETTQETTETPSYKKKYPSSETQGTTLVSQHQVNQLSKRLTQYRRLQKHPWFKKKHPSIMMNSSERTDLRRHEKNAWLENYR